MIYSSNRLPKYQVLIYTTCFKLQQPWEGDRCKKTTNSKLQIFDNKVYEVQYPTQDYKVCYISSNTIPIKL